jgi:phosphoglycerate dehydrogenase-like enzyme
MSDKILITDSLFIFTEHEKMLREAGFEIERLDKPQATEEELIQAIKGKTGYILGGIEKVTDKIIDAANSLKAIVFTGSDWAQFIPAHAQATAKNIGIANAPQANAFAVAEYTMSLMLAMTRNIFELGRTGEKKFQTTTSLKGLTVGIYGLGAIGTKVAEILSAFDVKEILYYSRERKPKVEKKTGAKYVTKEELFAQSDIVTIHSAKAAGKGIVGKDEMKLMKNGSLIVNCAYPDALDHEALYLELQTGRLRAAQDEPIDERFNSLPLSIWFHSNAGTAFNTHEANQTASDMATQSIINLIKKGKDKNKVN